MRTSINVLLVILAISITTIACGSVNNKSTPDEHSCVLDKSPIDMCVL
jgi:hypothetical protein